MHVLIVEVPPNFALFSYCWENVLWQNATACVLVPGELGSRY